MSAEEEEDEGDVLLASATVGPDGKLAPISVKLQHTTEEEVEPPADSGGSILGDVVKGALGAAGTVIAGTATAVGTVAGKVIDAASSGSESSESDE